MKSILFAIAFFSLSLSTESFTFYTYEKEDIEVVFNNKMDKQDLENIQKQMLEKDIVLEYKELAFDSAGKLKSICFHVRNAKNTVRCTCKSDPDSFLKKFGFQVHYTEKGNTQINVGILK